MPLESLKVDRGGPLIRSGLWKFSTFEVHREWGWASSLWSGLWVTHLPQVFPSHSREHQYVIFSQLFFLVLFPSLRDVHFHRSRFFYLLEWISVALRFLYPLVQSILHPLDRKHLLFLSWDFDSTFFPVYFFKGKQRISFLAKTKLLHWQLSCFAKKTPRVQRPLPREKSQ